MEIILLKLPMRNLFTIQRTSKAFQDSIKTSTCLRRKMFLEPELPSPTSPAKLNPLLYATMLLPGQNDEFEWHAASSNILRKPRQDPGDDQDHGQDQTTAHFEPPMWDWDYLRVRFRAQNQFLCVPRLMEAGEPDLGGTWRHMIVVQLVPAAEVKFGGWKPGMKRFSERKAVFNRFCTFGEFYDWVQEQLKLP